jgi:PAS domain S-box-containing protein
MARDPANAEMWLLGAPPTARQTRWVATVAVCQVAALALLAPFASIQVGQINGFIPAVESVVFMTDLVTSVLLFSQFAAHRLSGLLVLACGYLFSALIVIAHALSFPGAFSPIRLPGAGFHTTPWLYWFWHFTFAVALLGYGLMRNEKSERGLFRGSSLAVIVRSAALVLALVCGLTLLTTAGHDYLPLLFADSDRGLQVNPLVPNLLRASTILACVCAIAVLWLRRRSVLDQWVMIVALAVILEVVIVVWLSPKRFDVGFYAGRLCSLLTSTIVMTVLLVETMRLYSDVARSNEDKIRRLVDSNIIGICIFDLHRRILEANDAFLSIVAYTRDDVTSGRLTFTGLTPPEWAEVDERLLAQLVSTGTWKPSEKAFFRKDGSRVPVLVGGATFGGSGQQGVAFVVDLTERKRAEAELAHANRVSTMGQLTASIAHEVNQPLAALLTNAHTAAHWIGRQPPDLEKTKQSIDRIVSEGRRAADIVSRIRDLSKKAPVQKKGIEINGTILDVIRLVRVSMSDNGVLANVQLAEGLPAILGDKVQLEQVILNLVVNAIEAMSGVERSREMLISTSKAQSDGVLITVRDSGPGLPQDNPERVFDAFYTTKTSGLGLGLSICRSIIEAHGGRLWATPNDPYGAVFYLTLPIEDKSLETPSPVRPSLAEGPARAVQITREPNPSEHGC